MDPKACLEQAEQHIDDGFRSDAKRSLACYRHWRNTGGLEPTMSDGKPGDSFALKLAHRLIDDGYRM